MTNERPRIFVKAETWQALLRGERIAVEIPPHGLVAFDANELRISINVDMTINGEAVPFTLVGVAGFQKEVRS